MALVNQNATRANGDKGKKLEGNVQLGSEERMEEEEDNKSLRKVSNSGQPVQTPSPIQENPKRALMEEGNDEGGQLQFEFHFPEEIWLMILALVDDEDRVNCCRALPYLDSISTVDKPVFLAKEVLPLVGEWLNLNELLGCRQVCKNWNEGVDQLMYSKRATANIMDTDCFYKFHSQEEVERFSHRFAGHPRSPFIDGTVHFVDRDEDMEYTDVALGLIRDFGEHIRILILEDFCEVVDPFNWYRVLHEALENTPNLQQLKLNEEGLSEHDAQPRLREVLDLSTFMVEHPMPFIHSLNALSLNVKGIATRTIQNVHNTLILSYGFQLGTLSIQMPYWKDHYAPRLVNLKQLAVLNLDSDTNLRRLARLAAPIRTLSLYATGSLRVRVLLQVIKRLPNLEELSIYLCETDNKLLNGMDISTMSHLAVPSVRTLKIVDGRTRSYNFLELFTGLRDLFIGIDEDIDTEQLPNENRDGDLKIFEIVHTEEIYESNVWELIPTLENAEIRFQYHAVHPEWRSVYGTRDGYNEYYQLPKIIHVGQLREMRID